MYVKEVTRFLLLCVFFGNFCYAQNDSIVYIKRTSNKLNIRADISTTLTGFNFYDKNSKKSVHLIPNERLKNRITLSYRKINLGVSFSPNGKPFNDDDEIKGPSKTIGVDIGFTVNKFVSKLFYNKTKGYYVLNTEDYRDILESENILDKFIKAPNVKSLQIGFENSYYFNGDKYSIKFARNQSEIQTKSVGSFIGYTQLLYSEIDGSEELFNHLPNFKTEGNNFRHQNKNYYVLVGFGYAYNYIITKYIYITASFYPAFGGQYSSLENTQGESLDKNTDITVAAIGQLAGGFQKNNFYGGGFIKFGAFNNPFASNQLASGTVFIMGYIGYRFNAPKFLENIFDKVERITQKKE